MKSEYSPYDEEPRTLINVISREEPSFEAKTNYFQTFSESVKKDDNMSLKNKCLFGGWILTASKVNRRNSLTYRFEGWLYFLCKIKRHVSYNYKNLFKLVSVALKLMNCSVNTTYFVKNHVTFLNYFNKSETQTTWNHVFCYTCEECIFCSVSRGWLVDYSLSALDFTL